MKTQIFFSAIATLCFVGRIAAQHDHSDVELGYDDTANPSVILIEQDNVTLDGIQYFESEMEDEFSNGNFASDEPGFATNAAENLLVNPGDELWLEALDAGIHSQFGVGYVSYYNPGTDMLEAVGRLGIIDDNPNTTDLILNGTSVESGDNPQYIDVGDALGDIHDHVQIDLLDDATAPLGAYGVLFRLRGDFSTPDGVMDISSDSFWVVWNHGMDEADFDSLALPKFGVSNVPEPSSLGILILAGGAILSRSRRRK